MKKTILKALAICAVTSPIVAYTTVERVTTTYHDEPHHYVSRYSHHDYGQHHGLRWHVRNHQAETAQARLEQDKAALARASQ